MGKKVVAYLMLAGALICAGGCEAWRGPKRTGDIQLSSESFGDTYYLYGYSYEHADFYRWRYLGEPFPDPVPDIINEASRVLQGGTVTLVPAFHTPGEMNGFALVGQFENQAEARKFFEEYTEVEDGLQFETISETVELYQVWIQKTSLNNYAKLLIGNIQNYEGETGALYNEVSIEYAYQPDGSTRFRD